MESLITDTSTHPVIGVFPNNWEFSRFGREFERSNERNGDSPIGPMLSVSEYRGIEVRTNFRDGQLPSEDVSHYRVVRPGQLVANLMWLDHGGLGVSHFAGYVSPAYMAFNISERVAPAFAHHVLRSSVYVDSYKRLGRGVRPNSQMVDSVDLRQLPFPLPPFETQQRIADYLDRETAEIDAAVADLDRYVELLNVKLESASREVFTELSANHPLIQTKFLVDITTGSGDTQDSQENGGFPFYVRSDTIQRAEDFEFDCDAVLTSGDGAGVGKIFHLAGGKFKAHQRVYVMHNFKRVSPQYFYWMFKSAFPDAIRYGGAKSTVDSVRRPMIANLKIPVPDHDAQEKASKRIEKLHHEVSALIAKSTKLRDLLLKRRSVLITEVVTGRKQV